jgi:hypothetical protein
MMGLENWFRLPGYRHLFYLDGEPCCGSFCAWPLLGRSDGVDRLKIQRFDKFKVIAVTFLFRKYGYLGD